MSPANKQVSAAQRRQYAKAFAALGDETRLTLLARLSDGKDLSISELAERSTLTRQAITKHLRVLERARVVRCRRAGREARFEFDPHVFCGLNEYLNAVSSHWDSALARLKDFVES